MPRDGHAHGFDLAWLTASLPAGLSDHALYIVLFATGLVGGVVHCAGMCGPFVVGRAGSAAVGRAADDFGSLARVGIGLLPFYHIGRTSTYALLGGLAGGFSQGFATAIELGWIRVVLLGLAAAIFLVQAIDGSVAVLPARWTARWSRRVGIAATAASRRAGRSRDAMLGAALGFLPCGMIYGALTAAASAGSALDGALAMAAFGAGTIPALAIVGALGAVTLRPWRTRLRWIGLPFAAANLLLLGLWLAPHG